MYTVPRFVEHFGSHGVGVNVTPLAINDKNAVGDLLHPGAVALLGMRDFFTCFHLCGNIPEIADDSKAAIGSEQPR